MSAEVPMSRVDGREHIRHSERVRMMSWRNGCVALGAIIVATACTGDAVEPAPAASLSATTTSTTVAAATTAAPPTTSTHDGDIDGDGLVDSATTLVDNQRFTLLVDMTALGHQELTVPNANSVLLADPKQAPGPIILGMVDVDHDGRAEVFVKIDQGASTSFFTIVRVVDEHLAQLTLDGKPVNFALGGSVTHLSVVGCGDGKLTTAGWSTNDHGQTFGGERDDYRVVGDHLVLLRRTAHTFQAVDSQPSGLAEAGYDLHCPPID